MAKLKKNFKGGLDSLIESSLGITKEDVERSRIEKEEAKAAAEPGEATVVVDTKEIEYLKSKIADLKSELFLWRTGKINPESFAETLKNHGLAYNDKTNEITELSIIFFSECKTQVYTPIPLRVRRSFRRKIRRNLHHRLRQRHLRHAVRRCKFPLRYLLKLPR